MGDGVLALLYVCYVCMGLEIDGNGSWIVRYVCESVVVLQ